MPTLHAIILDFDGLILETEGACYGGWRALFQDHGADYSVAEYQDIVGSEGDPSALFEARCGRPADWATLHRRRREVENALHRHLAVQPGVVALLDQARALGAGVGIASSSRHSWVDRLLEQHGLLARFDVIVCREDVARAKPAPDLYLEAVRRLGGEAGHTIAFEDSHHGSLAAKRAGVRCVVVPTAMTRGQDFSHADMMLDSLAGVELASLLDRWADGRRSAAAG